MRKFNEVTGYVCGVVCGLAVMGGLCFVLAYGAWQARMSLARAVEIQAKMDALASEPERTQTAVKDDLARKARADHVWLVGRWNVAASRRTPVELDPPFGRTTFTWDGQHFPHPTYKGGTAKAYAAFAGVLQTFLESDDNFDQLVKRGLLDTPLKAGGPGDGSWTLRQLITQFSLTNNFSTPDAEVCRVIRSYRDRMPWAAAENAEIRRRVEELNRKVD